MVCNQRCFQTLPEVQRRKTRKQPRGVTRESEKGLFDWVDSQEIPGRVPPGLRRTILRILDDILRDKVSEESIVAD